MSRLQVRPEAELDIFEAAVWYENEQLDLGAIFLEEVRRAFERIEERPLAFPVVAKDIRRAILDRFPFGAFFLTEEEAAVVIAVLHLHRHPASWLRRR